MFVVSGGRIDFKFETRKTTLYILDSDLSIYPAQSGKVSVQFSGYPARTDRAGHGFAYPSGSAELVYKCGSSGVNSLDGDVYLDPSNLGELTTLVGGARCRRSWNCQHACADRGAAECALHPGRVKSDGCASLGSSAGE